MKKNSTRTTRRNARRNRLSTNGKRNTWCVHTTKPTKGLETVQGDYIAVSPAGDLHICRGTKLVRSFDAGHWESAYPEWTIKSPDKREDPSFFVGVIDE